MHKNADTIGSCFDFAVQAGLTREKVMPHSSYMAMPVADRRQNHCACGEGPVSAPKIRVLSSKVAL